MGAITSTPIVSRSADFMKARCSHYKIACSRVDGHVQVDIFGPDDQGLTVEAHELAGIISELVAQKSRNPSSSASLDRGFSGSLGPIPSAERDALIGGLYLLQAELTAS